MTEEVDVLKLAELDAGQDKEVTKDKLEFLGKKLEELQALETRISKGQELLNSLQAEHKHLSENVIPNYLVNDCGLEEVTMADGTKVSVPKQYFASITEDNRPEAFKWLEDNGHGDLIKTVVTITYARQDRKKALAFVKKLQKSKATRAVELKESVHGSTLKSFVKERITEGDASFPYEPFSVFVGRKTKLTAPKKR